MEGGVVQVPKILVRRELGEMEEAIMIDVLDRGGRGEIGSGAAIF
jgi:hypothetical protein